VQVITQRKIVDAKRRWPRSASALDEWYRLAKTGQFSTFADLKAASPAIDKVGPLTVFDIGGNKLRLVAKTEFQWGKIYIREAMDHSIYDKGHWR
jgi:mRNA interferase HigB